MSLEPLTLMAVHAHPDDEASSTGGVLAKYAAEGIRTVVVTCTNGELGDDRGGLKPTDEEFDERRVVETRRAELARSCQILGVNELVMLGYRDSGMMGWPDNDVESCFWRQDVETAATPLVELIERLRPQVVLTYDANGFYGHPDHIQAHRITMAAVAATDVVQRLYFPTFARSFVPTFGAALREAGLEVPEPDDGGGEWDEFGTPDDQIACTVDCSAFADRKRAALQAHLSQTDSTFFLKLPAARFAALFGAEHFVKELDATDVATPFDDLFAALR